MIRRGLKLFFLLCLFHVEIHVKAEAVHSPKECWSASSTCGVQAQTLTNLAHNDSLLSLLPGAIISRTATDSLNVIEGSVFVETRSEDLKFSLPNGTLVVTPKTKLKIQRLEPGIEVEVLSGMSHLTPKGSNEVLNIPAGYKSLVKWVDDHGTVGVNLPHSLSMTEWVSLFHQFYRELSPGDLKAQLEQDFKNWRLAVETATQIQSDFAERKIAEAKDRKLRQAKAKVRREAEDKKLRELFRQKVYN